MYKRSQCWKAQCSPSHTQEAQNRGIRMLGPRGNWRKKDNKEISGIMRDTQSATRAVVIPLRTCVKTQSVRLKSCILLYKSYTS